MSKAAISLIQSGLRDLGYNPGPIDGVFGRKTDAAADLWLMNGGAATSTLLKPETAQIMLQGARQYAINEVIVHCSATRPDWMHNAPFVDQVAEIKRWHTDPVAQGGRGWRNIGYHWLISRSGQILSGRKETEIGAHVEGYNNGTIGICLIGGAGSSETDRFDQHFTAAQDTTLRQLLQGIGMRTAIRKISGHNQYAAKACPGFNVPNWLKEAA